MAPRRTKNKIASAAHIKRNTEGTSNEISFSVLDAAKMELEGSIGRPETTRLGSIPLFSLAGRRKHHETPHRQESLPHQDQAAASPGVDALTGDASRTAFASQPSFEYEIARRKGRRRLHRLVAGIAGGIVAVAVVAVIATVGMSAFETHEESVSGVRSAIEQIAAVDEGIVEIDALLEDPLNPDNAELIESAAEDIPNHVATLESARSAVESAEVGVAMPQDREAATSAVGSIDARLDMLSAADAVLEQASGASSARAYAVDAWNSMLSGDSLARDAAALADDGTIEAISASNDRNTEAIAAFQDAQYLISQASAAFPDVDFSAVNSYLEKRLEALNHAAASNNALLSDDTATAVEENSAYNSADSEAASLAQDLPESAADLVEETFDNIVSEDMAAYEEARTRSASTDSYLRSYSGA